MNYPRLHPKPVSNPPKRSSTHGNYPADEYQDDIDDYSQQPFYQPPRRRPVAPSSNNTTSPANLNGPRSPRRQDSYGAPPVSASKGSKFEYKWPQAAQQAASGYAEPKSTLVYPETFEYIQPPPPPKKKSSYMDDHLLSGEDLYGDGLSNTSQRTNDNYRPLPPPPEPSPHLPRTHVSPYQEQFTTAYPNERFHQPVEGFENPWTDYSSSPPTQNVPTQTMPTHIEMPEPFIDLSDDTEPSLPPAPKSPSGPSTSSPEPNHGLNREGSGRRPETRSSTSSIYSYTQERAIENDFKSHGGGELGSSPSRFRTDSFDRSESTLSVPRNPSFGGLRLDTEDLQPRPIPPPPPPHIMLPKPELPPKSYTPPSSYTTSPPIYRSHTEPKNHHHLRPSSNEPFAPTPPPKVPLVDGL